MAQLVLRVRLDQAPQVRQVLGVQRVYLVLLGLPERMGQADQLDLRARRLLCPVQRAHLLLVPPAQLVLLLVWLARQALAAQRVQLDRLVQPLRLRVQLVQRD